MIEELFLCYQPRRIVSSCGYAAIFTNASTTLNVVCVLYRIVEATATSSAVKPCEMALIPGLG